MLAPCQMFIDKIILNKRGHIRYIFSDVHIHTLYDNFAYVLLLVVHISVTTMITMFHSCNLLNLTVCMVAHSYIQMRNTKWFVMAIQTIFAFSFASLASGFDYRAEYNYNTFMFVCFLLLPRLFFFLSNFFSLFEWIQRETSTRK